MSLVIDHAALITKHTCHAHHSRACAECSKRTGCSTTQVARHEGGSTRRRLDAQAARRTGGSSRRSLAVWRVNMHTAQRTGDSRHRWLDAQATRRTGGSTHRRLDAQAAWYMATWAARCAGGSTRKQLGSTRRRLDVQVARQAGSSMDMRIDVTQ